MSGRRQKLLRRQQNQDQITGDRIRLKQLESLPAIPAEHVLWYLHTKFNGKTGYHYISISPHGSLFADTNYKNLVPIILHREFPVTLAMGRYHDKSEKNCVVGLVRVPADFVGVILDRSNNMYIKGDQSVVIPEAVRNMYLCDLGRVSATEYRSAIRAQQEYFDKKMMSIMDELEKASHLELNPYDADPYDAPQSDIETMNIDDVQADVIE